MYRVGNPPPKAIVIFRKRVFFSVTDLLNLEVDMVLFDMTSTYRERDAGEPGGGFRRHGHSKATATTCRRS
jgi:hypothetical protein